MRVYSRTLRAVRRFPKDREALRALYDVLGEQLDHLRAGNPPSQRLRTIARLATLESMVATVRHRTRRPKGALSRNTAKLTVFERVQAAAKSAAKNRAANNFAWRPRLLGV